MEVRTVLFSEMGGLVEVLQLLGQSVDPIICGAAFDCEIAAEKCHFCHCAARPLWWPEPQTHNTPTGLPGQYVGKGQDAFCCRSDPTDTTQGHYNGSFRGPPRVQHGASQALCPSHMFKTIRIGQHQKVAFGWRGVTRNDTNSCPI